MDRKEPLDGMEPELGDAAGEEAYRAFLRYKVHGRDVQIVAANMRCLDDRRDLVDLKNIVSRLSGYAMCERYAPPETDIEAAGKLRRAAVLLDALHPALATDRGFGRRLRALAEPDSGFGTRAHCQRVCAEANMLELNHPGTVATMLVEQAADYFVGRQCRMELARMKRDRQLRELLS